MQNCDCCPITRSIRPLHDEGYAKDHQVCSCVNKSAARGCNSTHQGKEVYYYEALSFLYESHDIVPTSTLSGEEMGFEMTLDDLMLIMVG